MPATVRPVVRGQKRPWSRPNPAMPGRRSAYACSWLSARIDVQQVQIAAAAAG